MLDSFFYGPTQISNLWILMVNNVQKKIMLHGTANASLKLNYKHYHPLRVVITQYSQ